MKRRGGESKPRCGTDEIRHVRRGWNKIRVSRQAHATDRCRFFFRPFFYFPICSSPSTLSSSDGPCENIRAPVRQRRRLGGNVRLRPPRMHVGLRTGLIAENTVFQVGAIALYIAVTMFRHRTEQWRSVSEHFAHRSGLVSTPATRRNHHNYAITVLARN